MIINEEIYGNIATVYHRSQTPPDKFKEIVSLKGTENILKDFVRQEMFLNPSDVSKENIKKNIDFIFSNCKTV